MANRVSATIEIGGLLPADLIDAFVAIVQAEGLSTEWEGAPIQRSDVRDGPFLRLMDHEVALGEFEYLERFCHEHGLPYARWCDGYGGEWGPQRVVYTGTGDAVTYSATEDDQIVVDQEVIAELGSMAAIDAYFAAANFPVPALRIDPNPRPAMPSSRT